jgi:hypothetical protein
MSTGLVPGIPHRVPAGWRVDAVEWMSAQWMTIELRHISGAFVRVTIGSTDEWAWVEDHLLPALAGLATGEHPEWQADADRVSFANGHRR